MRIPEEETEMIIAVDKAQKDGKHTVKHSQIESLGHELVFLPLPVGDYILVDEAVAEVIKRRGDKLKKMDLIGVTRRSVDSKYGMEEIYGDVIGKQHERFRDELILAQQNNIQLIILIESAPEVKSLDDVKLWKNWKQLYAYCKRNKIPSGQGMMERIEDFVSHGGQKPPVSGEQLYKAMLTMSEKYGAKWAFCNPADTGKAIIYLLTMKGDDEKR
jgi:ribosome-associated protein